jgi:hypothetical protein
MNDVEKKDRRLSIPFLKKKGWLDSAYLLSFLVGLVMAMGWVMVGFFSKSAFINHHAGAKTLKVVGFAQRNVTPDIANIYFSLKESSNDHEEIIKNFEKKKANMYALMRLFGISEKRVTLKLLTFEDAKNLAYINNEATDRYKINAEFNFDTKDVDFGKKFENNVMNDNTKKSLLQNFTIAYNHTQPPPDRYQLISDAIEDAKKTAAQTVENKKKLLNIVSIDSINEQFQNVDSHYNDLHQKQFSVEAHVTFEIKES